jgi:hypothetical protein
MEKVLLGSNGVIFEETIKDAAGIVVLDNATVTIYIQNGTITINKTAQITNASAGICQFEILETDIPNRGKYDYWAVVNLPNNKKYPSFNKSFQVV